MDVEMEATAVVAVLNIARKHRLASLFSKVSPHFQLPKHRFKQRQKAPVSVLNFKSFAAFQLPKYRFKKLQFAPVSVLNFKGFSAFPTSKTSNSVRMRNLCP